MGLILCIVLTLGQDICVSAAEDTTMLTEEKCAIETVSEIDRFEERKDALMVVNPKMRGLNKPSAVYNVASEGTYNFDFSVYASSVCYSGKLLTGITEAVLLVNAETDMSNKATYGIEIYREQAGFDYLIDSYTRYTDTDGNTQIRISNMDASKKYYFKIVPAGAYLSGWGNWRKGNKKDSLRK